MENGGFCRLTSRLVVALLLWPTITEQLHLSENVHHTKDYACPTAKTGLIGGGAFVLLDSCLFWLICLMLTDNALEDYFEEVEESRKGERTQTMLSLMGAEFSKPLVANRVTHLIYFKFEGA